MQYTVYAVGRCMPYSVYAVPGVDSWLWHGEIECDYLTSCFQVMVDLRMGMWEMRGDRGTHHEKLGLMGISWMSQFTIPDTAGMSPDPAGNYTDTRSSQLNQASGTPDSSYPLVSSTSFSSSSSISPFLIHNSNIITEQKVKLTLSISPCHNHELTPSTAYTEYNIHRVPMIICLPFIHMITSWPLNLASASGMPPYMIDRPQPALH